MQKDRRLINAESRSTTSRPASIPLRASAHPEAVVKVRPKYPRTYQASLEDDITAPLPVVWQYETPHYLAESSLASLSLFTLKQTPCPPPATIPSIDKLDTLPTPTVTRVQIRDVQKILTSPYDITEIDTGPPSIMEPHTKQAIDIADIPTVPPVVSHPKELDQLLPSRIMPASFLTRHKLFPSVPARPSNQDRYSLRFNPFDRLRWWLLYPGRLESLLWSSGTLLLVCMTVIISSVTALSLSVSHANQTSPLHANTLPSAAGTTFCTSLSTVNNDMQRCVVATAASPDGLQIALFSPGPFVAGATVHLQGHGFSSSGHLIITHDANQPCQPGVVRADQHGEFTLTLSLGKNSSWLPGNHELMVEDTMSGHRVMLAFVLCTANAAKNTNAIYTPVSADMKKTLVISK